MRDLRGKELSQTRVVAGMVSLLDLTSIRIGNEEYVRQNKSYGLATLRTRHLTIQGNKARLRFRAKGGFPREALIEERRLVRLLRQLKRLKGSHVFQYHDADRNIRLADAVAVNEYLRDRTGHVFTAKDFRTWKASAMAAGYLFEHRDAETLRERKKAIKSAVAEVAAALGNTPTVCRKYYIHAALLETFEDGTFPTFFHRYRAAAKPRMSSDETVLVHFLLRWNRTRSA
jgi:DNA topoisomerase-1